MLLKGNFHRKRGAQLGGLELVLSGEAAPGRAAVPGLPARSAPGLLPRGARLVVRIHSRKFASSSTKTRITEPQLFVVFEVKGLTGEISCTRSLDLSIAAHQQKSMNDNCRCRVAALPLFICSCLFQKFP